MTAANARCTCGPHEPFEPMVVERRAPGERDVVIAIHYAGICHSDIDHAHSTRGSTIYPLVPGHEIAGVVSSVGSGVTRFQPGDRVGVGNMVNSCRVCDACRAGMEQYCSGGRTLTYGTIGRDGQVTYGGYSESIVVDEHFVLNIPDTLPLERAAPLFCAGITLYSPLRHWRAGPGTRLAIVGFGGLGHVGVQIARAMGVRTTVFDLAESKRSDALRLGAEAFLVATPETLAAARNGFDLVISTVPVARDLDAYLELLACDGTLVNLAVPAGPLSISGAALLANRRSIAGTRSGGLAETQEMIDFCADQGIGAEVEIISPDDIDAAFARLIAGDVRYRFVIDTRRLVAG